jgi:hypothetical protein
MTGDPDAWERWKHRVIDGIEGLERDIRDIKKEMGDLRIAIAIMKTETNQAANFRGAIAGFLSAVATLIMALAVAAATGRLRV